MTEIVIVGSGATGVHFALSALKKGHQVTLVDVGNERPAAVRPDLSFSGLKSTLEDPVGYFLGPETTSIVYPAKGAKFYGFPPSKDYVFAAPKRFGVDSAGFDPVLSFARGGLAEAWTGGVYPLNDAELADFPIRYEQLRPHYQEIARRIGISAERDDLERFSVFDADYQPALRLDPHSERLLAAYARTRAALHQDLGFYLGRSRVATLTQDLGDRKACDYLGRCLWGCPRESLYAPSYTLRDCQRYPQFTYRPGLLVSHFEYDAERRVTAMVADPVPEGERTRITGELFVLAAGTLCSSKLMLDSRYHATGEIATLPGLMDNQQIMLPFLSLGMIGQPVPLESYQFHELAVGLEGATAADYVHGQVTTLKAASVHPIMQSLPLDFGSASRFVQALRAGLAVANIWLADRRHDRNTLTLVPTAGSAGTRLVLSYGTAGRETDEVRRVIRTMGRALRKLGCIVPPGMTKILPKGASIHYAGTLPMSRTRAPFTVSPECRSWDYSNLIVADGATFPFLPAKNLTFTLMANAVRVADLAL